MLLFIFTWHQPPSLPVSQSFSFFLTHFPPSLLPFFSFILSSLFYSFVLLSLLLPLFAPFQSATLFPPHFPYPSLSISLYLSGSCCPPNVLEGSSVSWHCWLDVYFYPNAKRLLITVDKFRSVTHRFSLLRFTILTHSYMADFIRKSYSSLNFIVVFKCKLLRRILNLQGYWGDIWTLNNKRFGHWQLWAASLPKCWGHFKQWSAASTEVLVLELFANGQHFCFDPCQAGCFAKGYAHAAHSGQNIKSHVGSQMETNSWMPWSLNSYF